MCHPSESNFKDKPVGSFQNLYLFSLNDWTWESVAGEGSTKGGATIESLFCGISNG